MALYDTEIRRSGPLILPCHSCIIVAVSHIKAVIFADEVVLLDAHRPLVRLFADALRAHLRAWAPRPRRHTAYAHAAAAAAAAARAAAEAHAAAAEAEDMAAAAAAGGGVVSAFTGSAGASGTGTGAGSLNGNGHGYGYDADEGREVPPTLQQAQRQQEQAALHHRRSQWQQQQRPPLPPLTSTVAAAAAGAGGMGDAAYLGELSIGGPLGGPMGVPDPAVAHPLPPSFDEIDDEEESHMPSSAAFYPHHHHRRSSHHPAHGHANGLPLEGAAAAGAGVAGVRDADYGLGVNSGFWGPQLTAVPVAPAAPAAATAGAVDAAATAKIDNGNGNGNDNGDDNDIELELDDDEDDDDEMLGTAAFEFRVLESVLRAVSDKYDRRLRCYDPVISSVLSDLGAAQWRSDAIMRLLPLKNALVSFERGSDEMLSVLTGLLTSNEDMLELFLTEKRRRRGALPPLSAHQDCELLLETFHREFSQIKFEAQQLRRKILATEDMVRISMDAHRNRLIQVQAHIAMCGLGVGGATFVTSLFGMNLPSGLEASRSAFAIATVSSLCVVAATYLGIYRKFLRRPAGGRHFVTVRSPRTLVDLVRLRAALDGAFDFQDVILQLDRHAPGGGGAWGSGYGYGYDGYGGAGAAGGPQADAGGRVSRAELAKVFEEARGRFSSEEVLDLIFSLYAGDARAPYITMEQLRLFLCDFPSARWTGRTY